MEILQELSTGVLMSKMKVTLRAKANSLAVMTSTMARLSFVELHRILYTTSNC